MRISIIVAAALVAALSVSPAAAETRLKVMTFNVYGAGLNGTGSIAEVAAAIRAAGADVVGVQEVRAEKNPCTADDCPADGPSVAADLAKALGWHVHDQTAANEALWANAVISRYPIGAATAHDLGVPLDVEGRKVWLFNLHLDDSPYQPYQAMGIEYGAAPFTKDPKELARFSAETRGGAMKLFAEDLKAADGADAVFVTGDFNEPSHLDWSEAAVKAGLQPVAVDYVASTTILGLGFTDALRAVFPDVAKKPAFTWTPTTAADDPTDHHDRIDFVYARGAGLEVLSAAIVGEKAPEADVVVTPWPSDHRAVVAEVAF
ncbi:endonuclease/exonuclease/phosphatase family protein [Oharaeibacter diazotrophicus]|uniref:Endonuclease/exonuclease/phosphatase family metal-dependent hydrolase n=1 Tax=Oharaeibacter diazotrophicus TaxID=1920512 RepID=A0A4R6R9C6_9HYPH|nr:endonuclease/exonuclease/phosphatase family protein [Oharaeibacter diazotrophicus]TDP82660.1 endonuclease/exonuclease/phosphatase family metal-dependent hydrolase [Oharaeibacter diazotrophicus]BBE72577.1 endonuclease/exonuclease/phosphatase family protein [Pleomorphomonas sp. SM30]GLS76609.1 endonuclease [Oharaeibacter diazotrophicus]